MSEIEKMYENAGFKKQEIENCTYKNSTPCGHICDDGEDCPYLEIKEDYPPFTAEKQIELCKWLIKNYHRYVFDVIEADSFETDLAKFMNEEWQDLTVEEKQQVKGILE